MTCLNRIICNINIYMFLFMDFVKRRMKTRAVDISLLWEKEIISFVRALINIFGGLEFIVNEMNIRFLNALNDHISSTRHIWKIKKKKNFASSLKGKWFSIFVPLYVVQKNISCSFLLFSSYGKSILVWSFYYLSSLHFIIFRKISV